MCLLVLCTYGVFALENYVEVHIVIKFARITKAVQVLREGYLGTSLLSVVLGSMDS